MAGEADSLSVRAGGVLDAVPVVAAEDAGSGSLPGAEGAWRAEGVGAAVTVCGGVVEEDGQALNATTGICVLEEGLVEEVEAMLPVVVGGCVCVLCSIDAQGCVLEKFVQVVDGGGEVVV